MRAGQKRTDKKDDEKGGEKTAKDRPLSPPTGPHYHGTQGARVRVWFGAALTCDKFR